MMNAVADRVGEGVGHPDYRRFWVSLYRRDVEAAGRIVDYCLRHWPARRIYLRLFEPALNLSGSLYAEGRIGYPDEHFVTWHTLRFMRLVRRRFVRPHPTGPLALAAGVGQESHLIGLRMVCDFLQHDNWRIDWYPSNDRATVRDWTRRLAPAAVLLSIGMDEGIGPAGRIVGELRRTGYAGLMVVGGAAINRDPTLVSRLGADLTAVNGYHLVRKLRSRLAQQEGAK